MDREFKFMHKLIQQHRCSISGIILQVFDSSRALLSLFISSALSSIANKVVLLPVVSSLWFPESGEL